MQYSSSLLRTFLVLSLGACGGTVAHVEPDAATPDAHVEDDAHVADAGVDAAPDPDPDAGPPEARLLAVSREGELASISLEAPWTVRATAELGQTISSARCHGGVCAIVQPSPADAVTIVDAQTLATITTITLERGADPRDVALTDDGRAIITQYGRDSLLLVDLETEETAELDLSALADADGLPEATYAARCGSRVIVQLRRVEHESGELTEEPAILAVVDLDTDALVDADGETDGTQGIELLRRPDFDMVVECEANRLYVSEPRPLMTGGGGFEVIDLQTLTASPLDWPATAQIGGFEVVDADRQWLVTHTEFGPGPSSHLNLHGGEETETYNTFAPEHVDDLALDHETDRLFFPNPCDTDVWTGCEPGVIAFVASTGERASEDAIDVGFAPIELAIAR